MRALDVHTQSISNVLEVITTEGICAILRALQGVCAHPFHQPRCVNDHAVTIKVQSSEAINEIEINKSSAGRQREGHERTRRGN